MHTNIENKLKLNNTTLTRKFDRLYKRVRDHHFKHLTNLLLHPIYK